MDTGAVLHPFQVNHVSSEIGRGIALDVVVLVGNEIRPRGPTEASIVDALGLDGGMVEG